jgi:hypothetical protein
VDTFGRCLGLLSHGKRGYGPVGNILCKIRQEKQAFCCWANSYCSCRIPEVLAERFLVQPVFEELEGSGKELRTVRSEGVFHPLGCACFGEEIWWTGISCGN